MIADQLTIDGADIATSREILISVQNVPCQAHEVSRTSPTCKKKGDDIDERLACLSEEVVDFEPIRRAAE